MDSPRAEKVAVVDEVRDRFSSSDAALLTEYRGIDVSAMAELRRALREAGGDYKIYKNTLVRLAVRDLGFDLEELLVGPTAIAFVGPGPDGRPGDAATVAKALKEFAKGNEALIVKGGILGGSKLSAEDARALAELPSRDQLFAEFAGSMESILSDFAGLLDAKLREFAFAGEELLTKGTLAPGEAPAAAAADEAPAAADEAPAPADEAPAPADEAPETADQAVAADPPSDTTNETETPAGEAGGDPSPTEES
jgi:large subunit ribosomal protein L10